MADPFETNKEHAMSTIAIVYHSGYGHTKKIAEAVAEGAGSGALLIAIDAEGNLPESAWETLAAARTIVFGSPTYMGSVSWQFKKFADASSKVWFGQGWKGKLFAGFTNSASLNGDKHSTLHYFMTLAMQHSGLWVGTGMMPANSKAANRGDVNNLGSSAGLMTATPSDAGTDEMVAGDLATAKAFGAHIAAVTAGLKAAA
jgi:NAD(P)H dehydrogenase (quinone)